MTEWFITSSVLILIVLLLRTLLKGKISLRLQYGLWALVLVRLLLPISLPASEFSVMNTAPAQAIVQLEFPTEQQSPLPEDASTPSVPQTPALSHPVEPLSAPLKAEVIPQKEQPTFTAAQLLTAIWIAGMICVGLVLLLCNLGYFRRLKKTRTRVDVPDFPLAVYRSPQAAAPCLFGLIRPGIYLPPDVAEKPELYPFVLTHEFAHYRHGDHLWSTLRCVCLAIHWFNPLVWLAAAISKQDAELVCDAAAIAQLGEARRREYGSTLIDMTSIRPKAKDILLITATMSGDKKALKERVTMIAKHPKMALSTLLSVILILCLAVACTFTGNTPPAEPVVSQAEAANVSSESTESMEEEAKPAAPEPGTISIEEGYQYGNMQRDVPSGDFMRYQDTVLFSSWDELDRLYSYDMKSGDVSLFCKYIYNGNLEQYDGRIFYHSLLGPVTEWKDGRSVPIVKDGVELFWHANGNLYVYSEDDSLLVYENESTTPRVLMEDATGTGIWHVVFGDYLYGCTEDGVVRVNLQAKDPQIELVLQMNDPLSPMIDGHHIYYGNADENGALSLWRCDMDGNNPTQIFEKPVQAGSMNFDDEYLYFTLYTDGLLANKDAHNVYRMSKADPSQVEIIAELPEYVYHTYTVPGYDKIFVKTIGGGDWNGPTYAVSIDGGGIQKLEIPNE